jgi:uncharacterized membrane protein YbhN (UPF0104 family)
LSWSRWRPFVDIDREARHRRLADAVTVVLGVVVLGLLTARAGDPPTWEADVSEFFLEAPSWISTALEAVLNLGSLWAVIVLAGGALVARRWRLARDLVVAGLGTWIIARTMAVLVEPSRSADLGEIFTADDLPSYPVVKVAVVTALVSTAAPYLVRPLRHVTVILPLLSAAAALMIPAGLPIDVLGALTLGLVVGAAIHLAFGSPEGRPTLAQVVAAAEALGVAVLESEPAPRAPWGEVLVVGASIDGHRLQIKALGDDAEDAKLLTRAWHSVWYRKGAGEGGNGLERVNREALVTLLAERAGVEVPSVLAVGGDHDLALLIEQTAHGRPLDELDPAELTDELLERVWRNVADLHTARLAHGELIAPNVLVTPNGGVQLISFGLARTPTTPAERHDDVAELLTSIALLVGPERSLAAAYRVIGDDLLHAVPYLQPAALTPEQRDAVKVYDKAAKVKAAAGVTTPDAAKAEAGTGEAGNGEAAGAAAPPKVLAALRSGTIELTGAETPEPVKLQRITWGGAAMVAATLFGVWLLLSQLTSLDGVLDELRSADPWWVLAAIVTAQFTAFTDAIATMGSVNRTIAYAPTVVLQYAQKFTGLVVPSTLGTTAMNARYLNLQGLAVASAITAGVLASVGGFVVQIILFVVCVLLTGPDLNLGQIDASEVGIALLIGVVAVGALVTLVWVVPRLRAMIVPRVKQAVGDVVAVLRTPAKALRILGGNCGSQLIYATTLGLSLAAFGTEISFPALIVVNTAASLFAGLMPVPGGIGVAEAALAAGLMAYGVPSATAGAAAMVHRLATFYLPPIWGWFAFRWLTKKEYL